MRVLVAGASGNLGRELVRALSAKPGVTVIAHARHSRRLGDLAERVGGVRRADLTKPDEVEGICRGVDIVVSAVGLAGLDTLFARHTHEDVDYGGNLNLLRDAEIEGVHKFVYVSVKDVDVRPLDPLRRAKRMFERALQGSELDWLIVRPTGYFEDVAEGILAPARRGLAFVVGSGEARFTPVHVADVAEWIADHLDESRLVVEVGGPEEFSYNELAELCFSALGKRPRVVHVPPGLLSATAALARPLPLATSGELRFLRFAMTHDLVAPPVGRRSIRDFLEGTVRAHREARTAAPGTAT